MCHLNDYETYKINLFLETYVNKVIIIALYN